MFKRMGEPVLIDEVCSFDPAKSSDVSCKCGVKLGQICGGVFAPVGEKPMIITAQLNVKCANCGETRHV